MARARSITAQASPLRPDPGNPISLAAIGKTSHLRYEITDEEFGLPGADSSGDTICDGEAGPIPDKPPKCKKSETIPALETIHIMTVLRALVLAPADRRRRSSRSSARSRQALIAEAGARQIQDRNIGRIRGRRCE